MTAELTTPSVGSALMVSPAPEVEELTMEGGYSGGAPPAYTGSVTVPGRTIAAEEVPGVLSPLSVRVMQLQVSRRRARGWMCALPFTQLLTCCRGNGRHVADCARLPSPSNLDLPLTACCQKCIRFHQDVYL